VRSAADRVDGTPELDDRAVAGALDDSAVMGGDCRVDEIGAKASQAVEVRSSSAPANRE